ncbi:hypothetical protein FDP41_010084 [Naegleria fowleri]|uniref:Uncharacterized protein n=1 Tax=Naegleria fowleri TaxID=5763 RepID=A0A6A5BAC0_NAEFO|nr:uncharacterized protein FDP41_010084 [Naegleria fowleri]KAF0971861.1 hypothetical protein FDP41_010084 [Naegleria fowleri]
MISNNQSTTSLHKSSSTIVHNDNNLFKKLPKQLNNKEFKQFYFEMNIQPQFMMNQQRVYNFKSGLSEKNRKKSETSVVSDQSPKAHPKHNRNNKEEKMSKTLVDMTHDRNLSNSKKRKHERRKDESSTASTSSSSSSWNHLSEEIVVRESQVHMISKDYRPSQHQNEEMNVACNNKLQLSHQQLTAVPDISVDFR